MSKNPELNGFTATASSITFSPPPPLVCEVCAKECAMPNPAVTFSVGQVDSPTICFACFNRGILWAARQAHKEATA